jgi:hypothetical protein
VQFDDLRCFVLLFWRFNYPCIITRLNIPRSVANFNLLLIGPSRQGSSPEWAETASWRLRALSRLEPGPEGDAPVSHKTRSTLTLPHGVGPRLTKRPGGEPGRRSPSGFINSGRQGEDGSCFPLMNA